MKKIILLTLLISFVLASDENINFRHITVEKDGLSESSVYDIFQDSKGFIWITTDNGLDKYNINICTTTPHPSARARVV